MAYDRLQSEIDAYSAEIFQMTVNDTESAARMEQLLENQFHAQTALKNLVEKVAVENRIHPIRVIGFGPAGEGLRKVFYTEEE